MKLIFTSEDFRLRSNLTTNKTIRFTEQFFNTILGFTQPHSSPSSDTEGLYRKIPGT